MNGPLHALGLVLGCHCEDCWRANISDLVRKAARARPDEHPLFRVFNGVEVDEVMRQMARVAPNRPYSYSMSFGWAYNSDSDPGDEERKP